MTDTLAPPKKQAPRRPVAEMTHAPADDPFSRLCQELGGKIIDLLDGYPRAVMLCALPGLIAAVATTFEIPRETIIEMMEMVWNVPGRLHPLMHWIHLTATQKNPNHFWITFDPNDQPDHYRVVAKWILIKLQNAGLRWNWREIERP